MPVTLFCPNLKCRCILQVPENARGKKVRCAACRTTFFVPTRAQNTADDKRPEPAATDEAAE
jgi:LSD1 subclass zinc finger protein